MAGHPVHAPRSTRRIGAALRHSVARPTPDAEAGPVLSVTAARTLATARVGLGFVFLWAFLDKTLGWGYATPSGRSWVDGGSPTKGFLSHVSAGPLRSAFHHLAGQTWADWLFMLGLLGIGLALVGGVALRIAAVGGTVLMALMWAAEWPPARHLADGTASGSSNPVADYHLVYALLLIALAATGAGSAWGAGRRWAQLPVVRDHAWLR
jgi:thiosulfate dehydrogenase [quinone] large subunit